MVDLFVSTVHCKYSSIILQDINIEKINIHDISQMIVPQYITSVPTLVYNKTMYIGYENIMHVINTELSHILKKKRVADILQSIPKPKINEQRNQSSQSNHMSKSLISQNKFKPVNTKDFGELLPQSLKKKTSKVSYNEKADLKSNFDEMMKRRNKLE